MGISSFLGKLTGSAISETANGLASAIDRFVETPEEKKAAEQLLMKIQQEPDKWQIEINKIEAAHKSIFIAGWRPFIGWICGAGLSIQYVIIPILYWVFALCNKTVQPLEMDIGELITILLAMLGMAATRTYEKKHNLTR